MMNKDIERIAREKCAEFGIEYDDSITQALENGEAPSEDVPIETKSMCESLTRKMGNAFVHRIGRKRQIELRDRG